MALNLREKLAKVSKALGLNTVALALARSRHAHFHKIAAKAENQFEKHSQTATTLRTQHKLEAAKVYDRRANRAKTRSENAANRARKWVGPVKERVQRQHDLEQSEERLHARIKKLKAAKDVKVEGNKVTGKDHHKRLQVGMLASAAACAGGRRHNFYSQLGSWDIDHCITGPASGHRDDCSSWGTSLYRSCGLPDPNGHSYRDGFTGTLEANGRQVSIHYAMHNPGCAILYGNRGATHHVEFSIGDGTDHTIGHGSAPVDMGVFDLFGDGNFRCYKYALS